VVVTPSVPVKANSGVRDRVPAAGKVLEGDDQPTLLHEDVHYLHYITSPPSPQCMSTAILNSVFALVRYLVTFLVKLECRMHIQVILRIERTIESVTKPSIMIALRYFTDAEILWKHAKIWLPWQQGSVRVVFE